MMDVPGLRASGANILTKQNHYTLDACTLITQKTDTAVLNLFSVKEVL